MSYARIIEHRSLQAPVPKSHAWHVLGEAARIEPDEGARIAWYRNDPIYQLDRQTAEALVASGRHDEVLGFLRQI